MPRNRRAWQDKRLEQLWQVLQAGAARLLSPALLSDTRATPIATSSPAKPIPTTVRAAFHLMPVPGDPAT